MFALRYSSCICPWSKESWYILVRYGAKDSALWFKMNAGILSGPEALNGRSPFSSFNTPLSWILLIVEYGLGLKSRKALRSSPTEPSETVPSGCRVLAGSVHVEEFVFWLECYYLRWVLLSGFDVWPKPFWVCTHVITYNILQVSPVCSYGLLSVAAIWVSWTALHLLVPYCA